MSSIRYALSFCACICILCLVGHALAASGAYWTKSYPLQQGQSVIHQVQVDSSALFSLTSPPGAQFVLYAVQIPRAGAQYCPPEAAIRGGASHVSPDAFILPMGQWCIAVHAQKGRGTYYLEASSVVGGPILPATPIPMLNNYPTAKKQPSPKIAKPPSAGFTNQQFTTFEQNFFFSQTNT